MAELADAADSKSAEVHPSWGFNSPSRHHRLFHHKFKCNVLRLAAIAQDFALRLCSGQALRGSDASQNGSTKRSLGFARDFGCRLPLGFTSLTPAERLNFTKLWLSFSALAASFEMIFCETSLLP